MLWAAVRDVYPSEIVRFIDDVFPWAARPESLAAQGSFPSLSMLGLGHVFDSLVHLVEQLQPELMPAEQKKRTQLLVATSQIKSLVASARAGASAYLPKETYGLGSRDPITYIREALEGLSDQVIVRGTSSLRFLNDADLADSLRADISTSASALRNGEWKAASVIAGSAIEALLLWASSYLLS